MPEAQANADNDQDVQHQGSETLHDDCRKFLDCLLTD